MPPDQSDMNTAMLGALTAKAGDAIGAVASNVLGLRTSGATMVGILESRTIQDDLINQFDLRKVYSKKRYNDARKVLEKRTNISEDKKSGIIAISVEDANPDRAAALGQGVRYRPEQPHFSAHYFLSPSRTRFSRRAASVRQAGTGRCHPEVEPLLQPEQDLRSPD